MQILVQQAPLMQTFYIITTLYQTVKYNIPDAFFYFLQLFQTCSPFKKTVIFVLKITMYTTTTAICNYLKLRTFKAYYICCLSNKNSAKSQ